MHLKINKHSQNCKDEFYSKENKYLNQLLIIIILVLITILTIVYSNYLHHQYEKTELIKSYNKIGILEETGEVDRLKNIVREMYLLVIRVNQDHL